MLSEEATRAEQADIDQFADRLDRMVANVELAFFKINAVVGFVVLGFVAAGVLL